MGRALVQVPGERTCLSTARNAEIFPIENELTQRAVLRSRNPGANSVLSLFAVAFSRIQVGSPPAQAVQKGSLRLQAVDSMANRACGRRARIGVVRR